MTSFNEQQSHTQEFLKHTYERLREKLLDYTLRNHFLNFPIQKRNSGSIRLINCDIASVITRLQNEDAISIESIPEPLDAPADEKTPQFLRALEHGKITDAVYLTAIENIDGDANISSEAAHSKAERSLRDRIRKTLNMPPLPTRTDIDIAVHAKTLGIEPNFDLTISGRVNMPGDAIFSLDYRAESNAKLAKIRDKARSSEQEAGYSSLALAAGFLEWYESPNSDKPYYAPLLLQPLSLEEKRVNGHKQYLLKTLDEELEGNLTLQKYMLAKFDFAVPSFNAEDGASDLGLQSHFRYLESAVDKFPRWRIHNWLTLSNFSFNKIAIYEDTRSEKWKVSPWNNQLIRAILSGESQNKITHASSTLSFGANDDYAIDENGVEEAAPVLIHDADASQHSALIDAMHGTNLVIQGPPGTGKSQTITNIIANALFAGKTVLFLAEKQAALEAVRTRLLKANLADFCFEIHSDKSTKQSVLLGLKKRLELQTLQRSSAFNYREGWEEAKSTLNAYVAALHQTDATEITPYQALWRSLSLQRKLGKPTIKKGAETLDTQRFESPIDLRLAKDSLTELQCAISLFSAKYGSAILSPWYTIDVDSLTLDETDNLKQRLLRFAEIKKALQELEQRISNLGFESYEAFEEFIEYQENRPARPSVEALNLLADHDLNSLDDTLAAAQTLEEKRAALQTCPIEAGQASTLWKIAQPIETNLAPAYRVSALDTFLAKLQPTIAAWSNVLQSLKAIEPLLTALGIDNTARLSSLETLLQLSKLAIQIDQQVWALLDISVSSPSATLEAISNFKEIAHEEIEIRRLFPLGRHWDWPTREEIIEAKREFQRSGIQSLFGKLSGSRNQANLFLENLGFDLSTPDTATCLHRLLVHRERLYNFTLPTNASQFGKHWRGLQTPFEKIEQALKAQSEIQQVLEANGPLIQLSAIMRDGVSSLLTSSEPHLTALLNSLKSAAERGDRLDQTRKSYEEGVKKFQAIASTCDLEKLKPLRCSFEELRKAAATSSEISLIEAKMEKDSLLQAVCSYKGPHSDLKTASAWIAWMRNSPNLGDFNLRLQHTQGLATVDEATHVNGEIQAYIDELRKLTQHFTKAPFRWNDEISLDKALEEAQNFLTTFQHHKDLRTIRSLRKRALELGLREFMDFAQAENLSTESWPIYLESIVLTKIASRHYTKNDLLNKTSSDLLDIRRNTFASKDRQKLDHDRAVIYNKLLSKAISPGARATVAKNSTGRCFIEFELQKQKRHATIRKLLEQAGDAIIDMKPCFMMSPLSLSKFVPPDRLQFDILIIDEASQMRPEQALSGLLRANQVIVVGDRQQLPPSSSFGATLSEEDEEDETVEIIDDESILERCQKVFSATRSLKWHYRSRCESLIRFSNENFYEDGLITFPSPVPGSFSVSMHQVEGVFKQKAKHNSEEAEAIAEHVLNFMIRHSREAAETIPTLGVVAMNAKQAELITNLIERRSLADEEVQIYLQKVAGKNEDFFVKNLENVQGDERDHIVISMTYGPQIVGAKMPQRFGEINRSYGGRRLNVLFSRARQRMTVFHSFGPEDIRIDQSTSMGVKTLRKFFEYALSKGQIADVHFDALADSDFETEVANGLIAAGYNVTPQVGVTGYRIDIGVRSKKNPGIFLAGIECDGASYHSSKSARDRDRLREEVLNGLGWKILRVWSTDWFDDPEEEMRKLLDKLDKLQHLEPQAILEEPSIEQDVEVDLPHDAEPTLYETTPVFSKPSFMKPPSKIEEDIHSAYTPPIIDLLNANTPLTSAEARELLETMRDTVIRNEIADWDPRKSILRDGMIEIFIARRINDPDDWSNKIDRVLRENTNPLEKKRYLNDICDVIERIT